MNKKFILGLLVGMLLVSTFFSLPWLWSMAMGGGSSYGPFEPFTQVFTLIRNNYVDKEKTDPKKLVYGAIKGMVNTLDPFSQFMEPESYKDMMTETRGQFGGIGIEIALRENQLTVIAPIEGTPAERANIKAGDRITKINGQTTENITIMDAVSKMRGVPGTEVVITLQREGVFDAKDLKIIREVIKIQSVKQGIMFDGNIGYVRLSQFMETSSDDLKKALDDLKKKGMKKIVFDLRNDPGGLLEMAKEIASFFIAKGSLVVYTEGRDDSQNRKLYSEGYPEYQDFPLVVLVNKGSASASEIVSGAIQDLKRGLLIGQTTFGKASVQTIQPLSDGSALRLTTAHYFTPNGRMIHEKGIKPDIVVEDEIKPTDETKKVFEKDVFYSFAHQWVARQKKLGKEISDDPKVSESMKKEFLKYCGMKQTPLSPASMETDKELIEKEICISIIIQNKGEEAAKLYVLNHDKVMKRAIEELKKID